VLGEIAEEHELGQPRGVVEAGGRVGRARLDDGRIATCSCCLFGMMLFHAARQTALSVEEDISVTVHPISPLARLLTGTGLHGVCRRDFRDQLTAYPRPSGQGDSPILLRGLRKIGTVPDGSRIGS